MFGKRIHSTHPTGVVACDPRSLSTSDPDRLLLLLLLLVERLLVRLISNLSTSASLSLNATFSPSIFAFFALS